MKLNALKIFTLFFVFVGLTDLSILYNTQILFIRPILTFITAILVPGILFNLILKLNKISKFEYFLYAIGSSVALLMLTGLGINYILPTFFHINNPLSFTYIFSSFNILTILLFISAILRNLHFSYQINFPIFTLKKLLFYIIPVSFPILSILGAIYLNNGGLSIFTMIMLGLSSLYIGIITLFKKNFSSTIFPFTLLMLSLAVLLMLSLRSWYIAGFDISIEYEVFKLTQEKMHWAMANFKDEYNACLSITIFPTYLSSLLHIRDEYIYKLFYQIIFAVTPVGIYYLVKKLNQNTLIAFLSGLFYMCNPWFIDPMTTLNRQEFAFFFFILILILLFEKSMSRLKKYTLLSLLTIGLVVSHYASTYITIILFSLTYFVEIIINFGKKIKIKFIKNFTPLNINIFYLIFLIGVTYVWFSLLNSATTNLSDVTKKTLNSLPNFLKQNTRTTIIDQILNAGGSKISANTYQEYYNIKSGDYQNKKLYDTYNPKLYSHYKVEPVSSASLKKINKTAYNIVDYIYKFSLIFIEVALTIGSIYLLFFKNTQEYDSNLTILFVVGELLLFLIMALPYISVGYNFDRLYMQVMFILAIVEIIGGITIFNLLLRNTEKSLKALSILFVIVFLYTYGFVWQIMGGKTVMWMNNFGYYYNQTYTQKSDYLSALWIKQIPGNPRIYTTSLGRNIISAYAHKNNVKTDIFPSTIETYAYVYVTNINLKDKIASFFYRGRNFEYVYPLDFLNNNKNLIYNNGGSEIYK